MSHHHQAKLRVPCPSCHDGISIDRGILGRGVRCGACHEVLYVPYPIAERVFSEGDAMPAIVESAMAG